MSNLLCSKCNDSDVLCSECEDQIFGDKERAEATRDEIQEDSTSMEKN